MKISKQSQTNSETGSAIVVVLIVLFAVAAGVFFILMSTPDSESTTEQNEDEATSVQQEGPSVRRQNTSIKNDMARIMAEFHSYAANNNGQFPASPEEVNNLSARYLDEDMVNPITDEPYLIVFDSTQTNKGVLNYRPQTICEDEQVAITADSTRQITLSTILADDEPYCIEN